MKKIVLLLMTVLIVTSLAIDMFVTFCCNVTLNIYFGVC
jgi:hypothetical protein